MRLRSLCACAGFIALMASSRLVAQEDTVDWLTNYKDAIAEAKRTGKPIFLEYRCEP
jgi:hypothetical protein